MLLDAGVPKIVVRCVFLLLFGHLAMAEAMTLITVAEFFAGASEVTKAFQR